VNTPPASLPVRAEHIPEEMRDLARWVVWLFVWKISAAGIGKGTKVPKQPNGTSASTTDPTTWSTFDAALAAYLTGRFAGIGWMLQPPYAGIDFDHVLAGILDPDTAGWVARFESYTEKSVSASGLHVIVKADLPAFGRRRGTREAYSTARFFTVSGHPWPGTPATIANQPDALRAFIATLGTDRPDCPEAGTIRPVAPSGRYAELGPRTRRHLETTGPNGYPSASEADAAAAAALIATGHTAGEALALLLDSPRGQDALERKGKHGMAYWQRTIRHAASHVGPVVERGGVRVQYQRQPWRPRTLEAL